MRTIIKRILAVSIALAVVLTASVYSINKYVSQTGTRYVMEEHFLQKADAILVLGAYVFPDGTVSYMLDDRLSVAHELYEKGKAGKIIVSGDHGQSDYDEVNAMKSYLINRNIPAKDIFMDHAGFNTYQSIYRARDIFQVKKLIIVTQEYHLLRAVFIARELGIEAYGVAADKHDYGVVMESYFVREIAARNKDFFLAKYIRPKPKFLGDTIPVSGDGRETDDK